MSDYIAAEQFELTEAIRAHVEKNIESIREDHPEIDSVKVTLGSTGPRDFRALFRTRVIGEEFVAEEKHEDLYHAITHAKNHLIRQIREKSHSRVSKRRHDQTE
jgi:ribosomal subunit interface protein